MRSFKSLVASLALALVLWSALSLWCAPAHAAFVLVQGKEGDTFGGTSVTVTFTSNVTAGNAILVAIFEASSTLGTITVTDSHSDAFTNGTSSATNGANRASSAYAVNAVGGATTVTVTFSAAISVEAIVWVEEWSGIATSTPSDSGAALYTAGSGSAGQAYNSGPFTTTANGDLIWAFGYVASGGGSNAGAGFTAAFTDLPNSYLSEFQTQASAGSITPGFTAITGGFDLYALSAAFKAAGGGGARPKGGFISLMGVGR